MAKQTINIGAAPNDGTGTPLRTSFDYCNQNFTELYTATGPSGNNIVVPGSATITGDLTVASSILKVTGGNVGINTASPTNISGYKTLEIVGTGVNTGGMIRMKSSDSSVSSLDFLDTNGRGIFAVSNHSLRFGCNDIEQYRIQPLGVFTWYDGAGGTRMTLNSVGLGVGQSPTASLDVQGNASTGANNSVTGALTRMRDIYTRFRSNSAGISGDVYAAQLFGGGNAAFEIYSMASYPLVFGTAATERMRIDSTGNVGISVTPLERLTVAGTGSFGGSGNAGIKFHSASPLSNNLCWLLANDQANSNILNLYYYNAGVFSGRAFVVNQSGNFIVRTPATPPTIPDNEMMVFNLTSNTNLRISVKGTDGTTRTANITLA